jgi:RNA polymerase sigma factor (sigma-70 family)
MDEMQNLMVFHTLPIPIERSPYLQWHEDPKLKRYIRSLVADNLLPIEVSAIAQVLLVKLRQSPPQRQDYQPKDRDMSGCITALLAQILLSQQQGNWIKADLFTKIQQQAPTIELADIYTTGLVIISDPGKFLHNFKPNITSWYDSLCRFSYGKFRRSIVDRLRNLPDLQHFKRTNLGILVRASDKRVKTALTEHGEQGARLAGMMFLHQCLKETVQAQQFETKNPQSVHYAALLARYIEKGSDLKFSIPDLEHLKDILKSMGNALRNYEQPLLDSLDRSVGNGEQGQGTTLGEIVNIPIADEDNIIGSQEREQVRQQVITLLQQLSLDAEQILILLYGLGLTQTEAGIQLGCHQTTVRHRRNLIVAKLAQQLHQELFPGQTLTTDRLSIYVDYITYVCQNYYPKL